MIPLPSISWIVGGVAVLAIGGVLAHDHLQTQRANRLAREKAVVEAQLANAGKLIETMKADAALNKETSHALAERLSSIDRTRTAISVRCRPASAVVSTEGGAAAGTDDPAERGSVEAPLRDIGVALEDARIEAQRNNARFLSLQEWEKARGH